MSSFVSIYVNLLIMHRHQTMPSFLYGALYLLSQRQTILNIFQGRYIWPRRRCDRDTHASVQWTRLDHISGSAGPTISPTCAKVFILKHYYYAEWTNNISIIYINEKLKFVATILYETYKYTSLRKEVIMNKLIIFSHIY